MVKLTVINHDRLKYDNIILQYDVRKTNIIHLVSFGIITHL
jgi:hypothetical protein